MRLVQFFFIRFFYILQQTKVPKSPKGLPFHVFRHYETVQNSHFRFFFSKINEFFVSKGSPFNLFDILQQTGFSKSPKGPPFTGLKTLRFLSLRYSTDFRRSRLVRFENRSHFALVSHILLAHHCNDAENDKKTKAREVDV